MPSERLDRTKTSDSREVGTHVRHLAGELDGIGRHRARRSGASSDAAQRPVAEHPQPRRAGSEPGNRLDQRREVLRLGEPADADDLAPGRPVRPPAWRRSSTSTPFGITIVRAGVQVRAARPARSSVSRDADDHRGERPHDPVGPEVDARAAAPLVGLERPAVGGEDANRDARERRRRTRPRMPAFELFRCTMSGRSRRNRSVSSSRPSGS